MVSFYNKYFFIALEENESGVKLCHFLQYYVTPEWSLPRLDRSDADKVIVLHSNCLMLGTQSDIFHDRYYLEFLRHTTFNQYLVLIN